MLARDINWILSLETRCEYVHVRSNAESMRHTVSNDSIQLMPLSVDRTAVPIMGAGALTMKILNQKQIVKDGFSKTDARIDNYI